MQKEVSIIRSSIYEALRRYFNSINFHYVTPPVLTSFSCEIACVGGSDLISVNYFGEKVFLSQSAQLYLETLAMDFDNVYCINPAFRAESTMLASHLSEFWMCEAEMTNISFYELKEHIRNLLLFIIDYILQTNEKELELLGVNIGGLAKSIDLRIPEITYDKAISVLKDEGVYHKWGSDFTLDEEIVLTQSFNDNVIFITNQPQKISSFYKKDCEGNSDTVLSADAIAPKGFQEIVGGSLREIDVAKLKKKLSQWDIDISPFEWYFQTLQSYPIEHGGYGLGIERLITWICNLDCIQKAIPFPRVKDCIIP